MTQSDAAPALGPNGGAENFLLALRERRRTCADVLQRKHLADMADELDAAIKAVNADATHDNMIRLNGIWVRARWLMDRTEEPEGGPGGGRMRESGWRDPDYLLDDDGEQLRSAVA